MNDSQIDAYTSALQRTCKECGCAYTIGDFLEGNDHYFGKPVAYRKGCEEYCLSCWLGVGPNDFPGDATVTEEVTAKNSETDGIFSSTKLTIGEVGDEQWPYEDIYEQLVAGDLIAAFKWYLERGFHLAVMPIARVHVERVIVFPDPIVFYMPGWVDLDQLGLVPNREDTTSLAERCSAASGVTQEVLDGHPLIVFPCRFDWDTFRKSGHRSHLDFIRWLSGEIDSRCLNFVRYRSCRLEPIDDLPAHAGQVDSNHMMAGALLYNHSLRESRVIGGAAFTHFLTRGLGLPLDQFEWNEMPHEGEVGHIVDHALSLYAALLESDNPTARFMQALALLEFLASPGEYQKFEEVKKVISRYIARSATEYHRLLDRFFELTGKKDPSSGRIIGYRTRVVHMGERIEQIVPDAKERQHLFIELDGYIRAVIDHMIQFSDQELETYFTLRETMKPFESKRRDTQDDIPF